MSLSLPWVKGDPLKVGSQSVEASSVKEAGFFFPALLFCCCCLFCYSLAPISALSHIFALYVCLPDCQGVRQVSSNKSIFPFCRCQIMACWPQMESGSMGGKHRKELRWAATWWTAEHLENFERTLNKGEKKTVEKIKKKEKGSRRKKGGKRVAKYRDDYFKCSLSNLSCFVLESWCWLCYSCWLLLEKATQLMLNFPVLQ